MSYILDSPSLDRKGLRYVFLRCGDHMAGLAIRHSGTLVQSLMAWSAVKTRPRVWEGQMDVDVEYWTVGRVVKAMGEWTWTHGPVQIAPWALWPGP